jgi:hypothetical protein
MRKIALLLHLLSLTLGAFIYLCFRSRDINVFRWLDGSFLEGPVDQIYRVCYPFKSQFPEWFIYSLPDGLWLFSFYCLMYLLWGEGLFERKTIWVGGLGILLIFFEFCQLFNWMRGTFDQKDLFFYILASICIILIFYIPIKIKSNEQNST